MSVRSSRRVLSQTRSMEFSARSEVIYWRGPSPFHFLRVGEVNAAEIRARAASVTYGWGLIPVAAEIDDLEFSTSLFAKDGDYFLPLRVAVRRALSLEVGDEVEVAFDLTPPQH